MEKLWVKDVAIGQRAGGVFLVVRKQQGMGRNGKAFLKLTLQDRTGQLDARVWHDVETIAPTFETGELVEVEGAVDSFQGRPQLTIERLQKSEAQDPSSEDFAYAAPAPAAQEPARGGDVVQQIRAELAKVSDPHVRALLLSFVDDPEIADRLRRAPAAKEIHHAWAGGLADHVLSCIRLAQRLADHYPMVDRDLLVAGAFLHDLGKISELSYDKGGIGYTDEGRLVGHLVTTAQWIHERARSLPDFPRELELHLTHLVLAHHGKLEYGSPKPPMTLEAFLVHELDEIDSRIASWLAQMARAPGDRWAEPTRGYETLLWKAAMPTEEGRRKGPAWTHFRKARKKKREKKRSEETAAAAPSAPAAPPAAAPAAERRERPAREERREERRGPAPRILVRAEGAAPRAEPRLTFKPFSALTEEPTSRGAEGEVTPGPTAPPPAGEAVMAQPEAATTETLPETGPVEATTAPEPAPHAAEPAPEPVPAPEEKPGA